MNTNLTKIFDNIFQINSQFFYGEKVGVYAINLDNKVVLFDLPTYTGALKDEIASMIMGKEFVAVLSHGSCGISDGIKWQNELALKVYLHKGDENHEWLRMKPDVLFNEIPEIHPDLKIIHTPGHSNGSICLLYKPSKTLFTGDSIYSKNSKLTVDSDKEFRSEGLRTLLNFDFDNILPFHYEPVIGNAKEKLASFLN